jgi:hypothetical protein
VAFSRDGRHVVSGSSDSTIKIWDAQTGRCEKTLDVGRAADVKELDMSDILNIRVLTDRGWIDVGSGMVLDKAQLSPSKMPENEPEPENDTKNENENENEKTNSASDLNNDENIASESNSNNDIESESENGNGIERLDGDSPDPSLKEGLGYHLSTDRRWICRHDRNLVWLPPDYRPMCSAIWPGQAQEKPQVQAASDASKPSSSPSPSSIASASTTAATVAWGCPSGRVIVLDWLGRVGGVGSCLCLYLCISASLHLCISASLHLCISASLHLCISVCISVCLNISISVSLSSGSSISFSLSLFLIPSVEGGSKGTG